MSVYIAVDGKPVRASESILVALNTKTLILSRVIEGKADPPTYAGTNLVLCDRKPDESIIEMLRRRSFRRRIRETWYMLNPPSGCQTLSK